MDNKDNKDNRDIDTTKTYIFTNKFNGGDLVLAVSNMTAPGGGPSLMMMNASTADTSGQWFLRRVMDNRPGTLYRVHAASLGTRQSMDVANTGGSLKSVSLKMATSAKASGQMWRFDPWSNNEDDGYRLSNRFTGPDLHVDIKPETMEAQLFGGDFAGQHWILKSAAAPAPVAQAQDDVDATPDSRPGMPLSTDGFIAATVVGVLALGVLIMGFVWWFTRGRRSARGKRATMIISAPEKPVV